MPALDNAKYELFSQGVAEGKKQIDAYVDAGFKRNEPQASRLRKSPQVAARVAEILAEKRKDTDTVKRTALAVAQYDATRIVLELAETIQQSEEVLRRCMQYQPVVDEKGQIVRVQTDNGDIAAAYTFDAGGANKAIANKIKSLHLLGIDAGRFVHRHLHRTSPLDSLAPALVRELEQALAIAIEEAPGLKRLDAPVTIEGEKSEPVSGAGDAQGSPAGTPGGPQTQDS